MYIEDALEFAKLSKQKIFNGKGNCGIVYLKELQVPKFVYKIREKIIEENALHKKFYNPQLPDCIIYVDPNHEVPEHNDQLDPNDYSHIRANWIVQVADEGGEINIDDQKIIPEVNQIYLMNILLNHSVTKVVGQKSLIMYSFGFIEKVNNV